MVKFQRHYKTNQSLASRKIISMRNTEFSDIHSAWKCQKSGSAMQTRKETKDKRPNRAYLAIADCQTKTDVEVPSQPAEPIQFFGLIHAQPCQESAGKTAKSLSCKHTLALSITPLLTLAFPTCTNMQETAACKSFCCSTLNVFWSLEMATVSANQGLVFQETHFTHTIKRTAFSVGSILHKEGQQTPPQEVLQRKSRATESSWAWEIALL